MQGFVWNAAGALRGFSFGHGNGKFNVIVSEAYAWRDLEVPRNFAGGYRSLKRELNWIQLAC